MSKQVCDVVVIPSNLPFPRVYPYIGGFQVVSALPAYDTSERQS